MSDILTEVAKRKNFPEWFKSELSNLAQFSKRLSEEMGPAFYGDEEAFVPLKNFYSKSDAKKSIRNAERTLEVCDRFFKWWKGLK